MNHHNLTMPVFGYVWTHPTCAVGEVGVWPHHQQVQQHLPYLPPNLLGQKCKKKCEQNHHLLTFSQNKSWAVGSTYSTATRPREKNVFGEVVFYSGFNLRKCGKNLLNLLDLCRWRCCLNSPSNRWWENILFEQEEYPIYCGRMLKMNTEDSEQRSNESSFEQLLKNCFEVERI